MKSLILEDISDEILEELERQASMHRRSLQNEILALLADAVAEHPKDHSRLRLKTVRTTGNQTWSRDIIYGD